MTNTVNLSSVSQTFALASDSVSTAMSITSLCGPIEYSIAEGYSFMQVTAGTISLGSNSMADVGTHTATLKAKLTNYPAVAPALVSFSTTLIDPCLSTTITLPTTLVAETITSLSGLTTIQVFAPATDTAATSAGVLGLCGPRIYTIVETTPQGFVSIVAPATNEYSSNWSLSMHSTNIANVGTWAVTL